MSEVCEQYRQRGDRLRERRTRPRSGSAQEAFGELRLYTGSVGFAQNLSGLMSPARAPHAAALRQRPGGLW